MLKQAVVVAALVPLLASAVVGIIRAGCDVQFDKGHIHFRKLPSNDYVYVAIDLEGVQHENSSYSVHVHRRILQSNQTLSSLPNCRKLQPRFDQRGPKGRGSRKPRGPSGKPFKGHGDGISPSPHHYRYGKKRKESWRQNGVLFDLGTYMSVGNDLDYEIKLYDDELTVEVANATNKGVVGRGISVRGPDGGIELCCNIYDGDETFANRGDD